MEITYENINPLIVSQEEDGMMIKLKFQAENQPTPLETMAVVTPNQDEIMKNAMKQAAVTAGASAGINAAAGAIGGAIGGIGSTVARTAGSAASGAVAAKMMSPDQLMDGGTDEQKQAAIVQAFQAYATFYKWEGDKWVYQQPGA